MAVDLDTELLRKLLQQADDKWYAKKLGNSYTDHLTFTADYIKRNYNRMMGRNNPAAAGNKKQPDERLKLKLENC